LKEGAEKYYNPGLILASVHDVKLPQAVPVLEKNMQNGKNYGYNESVNPYTTNSQIYRDKIADLNKIKTETIVKMIIGEIPISNYDDMLNEMKKAGLDSALEDINKAYSAAKQ
jgi:hypothetical protein